MKIGEYIRYLREKKNLSQEDLAQESNITIKTLWNIEVGKTKDPGIETIASIASVLGVSIDSLISKRKEA